MTLFCEKYVALSVDDNNIGNTGNADDDDDDDDEW